MRREMNFWMNWISSSRWAAQEWCVRCAGSRLQKHIALIACLRFDITIFIEASFMMLASITPRHCVNIAWVWCRHRDGPSSSSACCRRTPGTPCCWCPAAAPPGPAAAPSSQRHCSCRTQAPRYCPVVFVPSAKYYHHFINWWVEYNITVSAAIAIGLCAVQNTRVLFGIAKAIGILSTTLFWILWISSNNNTWSTWTWDLIDILTRTWTEQFILDLITVT